MSDYRSRAHLRAIRRQKAEAERRLRGGFHLKRVFGQLRLSQDLGSNETLQCRVVLNDVTPQGARLFVPRPLEVEQWVALTLEQPKKFYITGRVVACAQNSSTGKIITNEKFDHRVTIEFIFNSDEERQAVKAFCDEMNGPVLKAA